MLSLYGDESGTDGRSPIVAVAGYVASDDAWAAFQVEWKQFCDDNKIVDFHTTDFLAHKKEFTEQNGWTEKRSKSASRIIDNIIAKHVEFGAVAVAVIADCEELFPLQGRRKFALEYAMAATLLVSETTKWAHKNKYTEPIRFIFDRGPHGKGYVMAGIDRWQNMGHARSHLVGGHSFENKKDVPQLLAADWLVNHTWRISRRYLSDPQAWDKKMAERIKKLKVGASGKVDRKYLSASIEATQKLTNTFYEETNEQKGT